MKGLYLTEDESRITASALQLLERELVVKLEQTALPLNPPTESLSINIRNLLDQHDAVSALTVMLSNMGNHWVNRRGVELAQEGLRRYVSLLTMALSSKHIPEEEFLIDHDLRWCQVELTNSSKLLVRLIDH